MRATKTLFNETLNRDITVRELSVGEIRALLKASETETAELDMLSLLLLEDGGMDVAKATSDLLPADIEALTPTELKAVAAAGRALNADFFALAGRSRELVDTIQNGAASPGSKTPPSP